MKITKEFILAGTDVIQGISGAYTTSLWDEKPTRPVFNDLPRPAMSVGWTDLVKETFLAGTTGKCKYYKPLSGKVSIEYFDIETHPIIVKHSMFHQFDTYQYEGVTRTFKARVRVEMELVRTHKEVLAVLRENRYGLKTEGYMFNGLGE